MDSNIKDLIADELRAASNTAEKGDPEFISDKKVLLEVIEGPDAGHVFGCVRNSTIGRGPADISLKDLDVSRLHALIEFVDAGQVLIRDTGSTNGTYVNGVRIAEIALKPQDEIKMGSTIFRFMTEVILEA